jgi:hypothetical protein
LGNFWAATGWEYDAGENLRTLFAGAARMEPERFRKKDL